MLTIATSTLGRSKPFRGLAAESVSQLESKDRILLVDDSSTLRKMFSMYLSPKFECYVAGSYDEALSALRNQEFAVVITDIIMPGMSGIELLRRIKDDYSNIEVIVASSVDRPQRALDAIRLGAFDYLIKPIDPDVLSATVERALERRNISLDARRYKHELEAQNAELVSRKEQLERLQEQVIQSEKMASIGQLAAGIAHELNNPAGFVYANMDMLDQGLNDLSGLSDLRHESEKELGFQDVIDDLRLIVQDCREGSERIRNIVQNLRTFSRLDEAEFKNTNIPEGINATVRLLSQYFTSGSISLCREFGELPEIGAFPGPLNQVWMNLLVNAAQSYGTGRGEVKIITRADEEYVTVEIIDNGCGIAVQHLKRIFDPFYTTKPVGEGTGLGLSITYGIVERHGGTISVESRLNEGTSFKVQLPINFQPDLSQDEKSIACYTQTRSTMSLDL